MSKMENCCCCCCCSVDGFAVLSSGGGRLVQSSIRLSCRRPFFVIHFWTSHTIHCARKRRKSWKMAVKRSVGEYKNEERQPGLAGSFGKYFISLSFLRIPPTGYLCTIGAFFFCSFAPFHPLNPRPEPLFKNGKWKKEKL